ncbi:hypothetical protein Ptr902_08326 [Pyrenophora tritici-repentis]|nr:hypothetical protein PtrV1_05414 [Pyrenophora tritici-repentis]KAF7450158.1 hypothetical protein A1F99_047740 [Pyrenophora tritici-repentis]KAI0587366.1 hypothetical protein Alg215_01434 [Pyrenophora tritici-repentis]KAI2480145.1 hypothetical protein Ptr902_08326 [Pyrenophora tritici-repentis]
MQLQTFVFFIIPAVLAAPQVTTAPEQPTRTTAYGTCHTSTNAGGGPGVGWCTVTSPTSVPTFLSPVICSSGGIAIPPRNCSFEGSVSQLSVFKMPT